MNLGWKLAAAVRGDWTSEMLDSYEQERHPIGEQVLRMTDGFNKMVLARTQLDARLRQLAVRSVVRFGPGRRQLLGRLSGIGLHYGRGRHQHRLTGRRATDLETSGGRLYEVLRAGRFVLLVGPGVDLPAVQDAVVAWNRQVVVVEHGSQAQPPLTLVRPDAYVAWADTRADALEALTDVLGRWCGAGAEVARGLVH
jgi:hypothetical protein